jgi:hypothetical protein
MNHSGVIVNGTRHRRNLPRCLDITPGSDGVLRGHFTFESGFKAILRA